MVCLHVLKKSRQCPDFGSINPCLALCNPIGLGSIPVFASVLGVQFYIVSEYVAMFMGIHGRGIHANESCNPGCKL